MQAAGVVDTAGGADAGDGFADQLVLRVVAAAGLPLLRVARADAVAGGVVVVVAALAAAVGDVADPGVAVVVVALLHPAAGEAAQLAVVVVELGGLVCGVGDGGAPAAGVVVEAGGQLLAVAHVADGLDPVVGPDLDVAEVELAAVALLQAGHPAAGAVVEVAGGVDLAVGHAVVVGGEIGGDAAQTPLGVVAVAGAGQRLALAVFQVHRAQLAQLALGVVVDKQGFAAGALQADDAAAGVVALLRLAGAVGLGPALGVAAQGVVGAAVAALRHVQPARRVVGVQGVAAVLGQTVDAAASRVQRAGQALAVVGADQAQRQAAGQELVLVLQDQVAVAGVDVDPLAAAAERRGAQLA